MDGVKTYSFSLYREIIGTFVFLFTIFCFIPSGVAGEATPVEKKLILADFETYSSEKFLSLALHDTIILQTPDKKLFIATVSKINRSKKQQVTTLLCIQGYPEGFLSLTTCGNALCGILTIEQLQVDYQVMANGNGGIIRFTEPDYFGKIRNQSNTIPTF